LKNLLEETKHLIRKGRTVGNTTRQVDTAIDLLHQGHEVLIKDHGETMDSNHKLLHMINKRLEFTYNHLFETKVKFSKRMTKDGIVGKLEIKE